MSNAAAISADSESGVAFVVDRELTLGDLDALRASVLPGQSSLSQPLQRLRQKHHRLAQLLAAGVPAVKASLITGYSQSRICILQGDPTFQELISYYTQQNDQLYSDVQEKLAEVGMAALEEIEERLESSPGSFENKDLLALMESTFDRSVAPAKGVKHAPGGSSTAVGIQLVFEKGREEIQTVELTAREVAEDL